MYRLCSLQVGQLLYMVEYKRLDSGELMIMLTSADEAFSRVVDPYSPTGETMQAIWAQVASH